MLKLLESPYKLPGAHQTLNEEYDAERQPLDIRDETCDTTSMKEDLLNSTDMKERLRIYFSKPPEWSLDLCVT